MKKALKELEIILRDKAHGSSELLNLIHNNFLTNKTDTTYLKTASYKIKLRLSHFPVIIKFIREVEIILIKKNQAALNNYLNEFSRTQYKIYENIFRNASEVLLKLKNVLTISHSKTVIKIFERWKNYCSDLKVIICESRPDCEGILMAEVINNLKIKTELISESMSGIIIKEIDAIIIGADQILPNGNVINKTGSRMLAVLAKYHKIPVYVLASSEKAVNKKKLTHKKQKEYKIATIKNKSIKFRNENFEEIEKELITRIFID